MWLIMQSSWRIYYIQTHVCTYFDFKNIKFYFRPIKSKNMVINKTLILNSFHDKDVKNRMYMYLCMIHDEFFLNPGANYLWLNVRKHW